MAKKYLTEGRTLYNYRGRHGRLTIVPTKKAKSGFAACDTYGTACRVLEAVFRDSVIEVGTEPRVEHDGLPAGAMHLDVRERHRSGHDHYTEVKSESYMTADAVRRLSMVEERLQSRGATLEFRYRDEVVERTKRKGLDFLYRFRSDWQPTEQEQGALRRLCQTKRTQPRSAWLTSFAEAGLQPRVFYWAIARGMLTVGDAQGLFPDGDVSTSER